jgi:hypothetical protein
MAGAIPPPGNYLIDYALFYTADELMGNDGRNMASGFDLTVWGNVLRYVHVSKTTILGASWAQHVFLPVLNVDVTMPTPGGDLHDTRTGLGDIIVDPLILGWHFPNCHVAAGVDVYVPVGAYDDGELANVGRNYWTFEPVVAMTCLKGGLECSAKVMYDINVKNPDSDVRSGDEFHVDGTIGMRVANWAFGIGGYYYQQVTEDDYPAGYPAAKMMQKGKTMAVGPQVAFQLGKISLVAKYQEEFETENRPEGRKAWLKFVVPL